MKKYLVDIFTNKRLHAVFLIALAMRLWGANYGLPHIFNMDEESFVRSVTGLRFNLNPNRFDWSNGYFYFHFIFYVAFYYIRMWIQMANLKEFTQNLFPLLWQDHVVFYFISRCINAFMGSLTIYPLFYASKKLLKNSTLAFFSCVIFIFIPYHVFDSHTAIIDTGLTFFCALLLYFIFSLLGNPSIKNYILSGFFLGIAFGVKYNAIFYSIPFLIVVLYTKNTKKFSKKYLFSLLSFDSIKKYCLAVFSFLFGFLLTNPYVLVEPRLFWSDKYGRGFLFQFKNVGSKELYEIPAEFIKLFYSQPLGDFGLGLYLVIFLGFVLYLFFNFRNKITNITLLMPLFLFLYMTTKDRNPSHYFEFLYPLLAIYCVYFIYFLVKYINLPIDRKYIFYTLLALIISFSVFNSFRFAYMFGREDTRVQAYNYLVKNVDKKTLVYYYGKDLNRINFVNIDERKIKRVDYTNVDLSKLPFVLFLGVPDLTYNDVMLGERDTRKIEGNEGRFLDNSDLLFYKIPDLQFGPPVFIFRINNVTR